jgi:glycosyltransferase involved in cell wall biosynthesis
MKLIWFSHFVPYPPKGGNLQRSYNLIRQASRSHQITLVALNFLAESPYRLRSHAEELKKYCEIVEFWELPYPWRGVRWQAAALASPLFRVPFSCRALYSPSLRSRWEQVLRDTPGALLHLDSIDLGLFVPATKGFRKVLNHHNCESAMALRRAQREPNRLKKAFLGLQARELRRMEQSICADFDNNLVVSDEDANQLRAIQPRAHFSVVENGVDTSYFQPGQEQEVANTLAFTGLLDWYPNVSGIRFFVREVWPLVKSRFADARLYLAGKNPAEEVLAFAQADSSIVVIPNPDDMRPILGRAAVCICPLLEGGGTRLKILDALAMGKPMVTTTIGCEGLRVTHGENILVADAPRDFADRLVQLFENQVLRRKIGAAGRVLVEREYCWDKIGEQLEQAYRSAFETQTSDKRYESIR